MVDSHGVNELRASRRTQYQSRYDSGACCWSRVYVRWRSDSEEKAAEQQEIDADNALAGSVLNRS